MAQMIEIRAVSIQLPHPQRVGPAAPDLNGDGVKDYVTATSWELSSSDRKPLKFAVRTDPYSFEELFPKVDGFDNQFNAMFARDILYADINNDSIPDLFPVDAVEVKIGNPNSRDWKWMGTNQYAYISKGPLTYEKILSHSVEQSSHTATLIKSLAGPPTIIYNTLGNSKPEVPSLIVSRYDHLSNSFSAENWLRTDKKLLAGNTAKSPYVQFFSIDSVDVNGDGSDDLVGFSTNTAGDNMIFLNDGRSNFNYYKNFSTGLIKDYVVEEVVKGDFNGDGLTDLVVEGIDRTNGWGEGSLYKTLRVLISDGKTLVDQTEQWLGSFYQHRDSSFFYMEPFDFNSDGLTDFAFAHFESERSYAQRSLEVAISTGISFEVRSFQGFSNIRNTPISSTEILGDKEIFLVTTDIIGKPVGQKKVAYFDTNFQNVKLVKIGQSIQIEFNKQTFLADLNLSNRIQFNDLSVAFDAASNAGQAYRIYKAAFNRDPMQGDTKGLGYWIGQIDKGMNLTEIAARFVDSNEFRSLYGTNPTNEQFLTKLYTNVLGRQPEASGFNWWLNELNTNPTKTKAKVLADFAESAENQTGVVSLIGNGITYEPWVG